MNKPRHKIAVILLLATLPVLVRAQPRPVEIPELNTQFTSSGVNNLRVASMSPDGTEALLVMEYTYNGNAGPNALIVPVLENRRQPGVSKWFGSDQVIVPRGKGPISIKVKYFNDEPSAPATLTTDSIKMLIMNASGNTIVGGSTELKTIHWGKEGLRPVKTAAEPAAPQERKLAQLAGEAEERAREKARRAAEAEGKARQEAADREAARAKAEAEARAAAKAHDEARLKDEKEAKRLDAERKAAEERARAEQEAQRQAAERAAAEAKAREEAEAQAAEAARIKAEQEAIAAAKLKAEQEAKEAEEAEAKAAGRTEGQSRTRITNIDVVNRSLDRSQMTFGIEFDRRDKFKYMGVNVEHSANPATEKYFTCQPKEVGRQKYALVQVAYSKPLASTSSMVTDRLEIFGCDSPAASKTIPLHTATMLLVWHAPGNGSSTAAQTPAANPEGNIEITDFRQRTSSSGYASITYSLPEGTGKLQVQLMNSKQPGSTNWFVTEPVTVKAGQGLELIPVTVAAEDSTPTGPLNVDMIEAELLDAEGKVIGKSAKATSITWTRSQ